MSFNSASKAPKGFDVSRIDVHIHIVPPSYLQAIEAHGGDPSGWPTPSWTLDECIRFNDTIGSSFSVLSVTAPGPAIAGPTEEGRKLTRTINDEVWEICEHRPGQFGFFASLPDFNDIEGTLAEIEDIFVHKQRANGVVIMTAYGDKLMGDEAFKPIWQALDQHKALVFVHPNHVRIIPEFISGFLPQPVIDYPQATTRAALSLVFSGILTECSGIDVILSHGGGTLPYLASRAIESLSHPAIGPKSAVSLTQAWSAVSRYYYDLAITTTVPQLKALEAFAPEENILYGSDFPYLPKDAVYATLLQYAKYVSVDEECKVRPVQLNKNAITLLGRHAQKHTVLPSKADYEARQTAEFGKDNDKNAEEALNILGE